MLPPVSVSNQVILRFRLTPRTIKTLFTSDFGGNRRNMASTAGGAKPSAADSLKENNGLLLYFHNYSFYSQKVVMALHEKRLPFKTHFVNIVKSEQYEPWFLEMNPRGEVPVLKDGVKIIPDSNRIIDYLEDNFSNGSTRRLIPRDQGENVRRKVESLRSKIDKVPIGSITMGSFLYKDLVGNRKMPFIAPVRYVLNGADKKAAENLRRVAQKNPSAHDVLIQKSDLQERKRENITHKDNYVKMLNQLDEVLAEAEDVLHSNENNPDFWLCCPTFTVADIGLTILLDRLNRLGLDTMWVDRRPFLTRYYERVQKRDSYIQTIPSTLGHLELFVKLNRPLILGSCIFAAVALIAGGIFIWIS